MQTKIKIAPYTGSFRYINDHFTKSVIWCILDKPSSTVLISANYGGLMYLISNILTLADESRDNLDDFILADWSSFLEPSNDLEVILNDGPQKSAEYLESRKKLEQYYEEIPVTFYEIGSKDFDSILLESKDINLVRSEYNDDLLLTADRDGLRWLATIMLSLAHAKQIPSQVKLSPQQNFHEDASHLIVRRIRTMTLDVALESGVLAV